MTGQARGIYNPVIEDDLLIYADGQRLDQPMVLAERQKEGINERKSQRQTEIEVKQKKGNEGKGRINAVFYLCPDAVVFLTLCYCRLNFPDFSKKIQLLFVANAMCKMLEKLSLFSLDQEIMALMRDLSVELALFCKEDAVLNGSFVK